MIRIDTGDTSAKTQAWAQALMRGKECHAILGIPPDASPQEIKQAYIDKCGGAKNDAELAAVCAAFMVMRKKR